MADRGWQRRFDDPIPLPFAGTLVLPAESWRGTDDESAGPIRSRAPIRVPGGGRCFYRNAWVTHVPRCSASGPSLTFAIIAAPNRNTKNVNITTSRQFQAMLSSPFSRIIRTDPTSSDARVIIYASCALAAPSIAVPAFWFDTRDVRALTRARSRRHDFLTVILPVVQRIRWADKSPSARSPRCIRRRADGSTVRPAILPSRALARREPGTARSDDASDECWYVYFGDVRVAPVAAVTHAAA